MVINENTVQINSFGKGMNSDVSLQMIPEGQYIYAENLRITGLTPTNSSSVMNGVGKIRPIEGAKWGQSGLSIKDVLATDSIRDIGVVIYVDNNDLRWKVAVFENKIGQPSNKDDNSSVLPTLTTIFNSGETTQATKFSTVMHYEVEDVTKLYIADGVNPIKLLLIEKENGEWKWIEKDQVNSYPKIIFKVPKFVELIPGSLKSGSVQYAYRLYRKYSVATDMSPTTKLIPIVNSTTYAGYGQNKTTNAGVRLQIDVDLEYTQIYNKMQVYRIMYVENGQLPTIELIYDDDVDLQNTIDDTGQDALGVLSLEEFNSISGIHIIPKVIESKNDYLFAAQIKDVQSDVFKDWQPNMSIQRYSYTGDAIDYSNPKDAYQYKSLRRGETYRFGVVLYDKYGNASGVFPFNDDVVVPDGVAWSFNEDENKIIPNPVGVQWNIENLPDDCAAYEIVRCRRTFSHMKNISQGVLARPIKKYYWDSAGSGGVGYLNENYPYTPTGFLTMQRFKYTGAWPRNESDTEAEFGRPSNGSQHTIHADNFSDQTLYQFVSPETSYAKDQFLEMTKDADIDINFQTVVCDSDPNGWSVYSSTGSNIWDLTSMTSEFPNVHFYNAGKGSCTNIPIVKITSSTNNDVNDLSNTCLWIGAQIYGYAFFGYPISPLFNTTSGQLILPNGVLTNWAYYDQINEQIHGEDNPSVKVVKQHSSTYINLYERSQRETPSNIHIENVAMANELKWDDVFDKQKNGTGVVNKYEDFLQNVGTQLYNNVVIGGYYGSEIGVRNGDDDQASGDNVYINTNKNNYDFHQDDRLFCALGGRCALLGLQQSIPHVDDATGDEYMYTMLCNIQKHPQPYNTNKKLDTYYSYGDYFVGSQGSKPSSEGHAFDGDTYIDTMEYVSMHKMYFDMAYDTVPSHAVIYSIPVETSINLKYTCGAEFSRDYAGTVKSNLQIEPSSVYNVYVQDKPLYAYNTAYSEDTAAKMFAVRDYEDSNAQSNIDYRVLYSNLKQNGEYIDSWLKFQPANYIDVDAKYGEVTHLRNFHNKLFFWQENATGVLSVNERVQITDESNMPLILGTGGVLERYDYLDNVSGMYKEHFCDTMSEHALYWFDDAHQEIKQYTDGGGIASLTKQLGVSNLMRQKSDVGVVPWMFYDNTYQEVVTKFNDGYSIVYNEAIKAFTSLYSVAFDGAVQFTNGNYLMAAEGSKIGQWDATDGQRLNTKLEYVVNKQPLATKVFDNQEVVMDWMKEPANRVDKKEFFERPSVDSASYLTNHHTWQWKTDLNATEQISNLETTFREGNYRLAVPREKKAEYGARMRGKYMICTIEDTAPDIKAGIAYIMTKFRTSWS